MDLKRYVFTASGLFEDNGNDDKPRWVRYSDIAHLLQTLKDIRNVCQNGLQTYPPENMDNAVRDTIYLCDKALRSLPSTPTGEQDKKRYEFDRIRHGAILAEGIVVHATSLEEAESKALAFKGDATAICLRKPPQAPGVEGAVQETPETDALKRDLDRFDLSKSERYEDAIEFARTLERERNEARRELRCCCYYYPCARERTFLKCPAHGDQPAQEKKS